MMDFSFKQPVEHRHVLKIQICIQSASVIGVYLHLPPPFYIYPIERKRKKKQYGGRHQISEQHSFWTRLEDEKLVNGD